MLVVTRKQKEKIVIPSLGVEVTVVAVLPNGRVRIGITAPDKARILREELLAEKVRR